MTAIWRNDGSGWRLLSSSGYPNEAALHTLVEQAPHILPLAGDPRIVVVGREVMLGNGFADLIAVEPSGRVVVIEVKLANNSEARRAVVAQVLTYAAFLRGLTPAAFEATLAKHLQARGYQDLAQALASVDQEGSFDFAEFTDGLTQSLAGGRFRLVIVLDSAPRELVRLVGYLEAVTSGLLIDLITVTAYDVDGSQILVPQRIEDDPQEAASVTAKQASASSSNLVEGSHDFRQGIEQSPEADKPLLRQLCDWAEGLERDGLVKLSTYHGKNGVLTLLPRIPSENAGLVTIYNSKGARLQFWRGVFERRAPESIAAIEATIAPTQIGKGNWTANITPELLAALTAAYREAASGAIHDGDGANTQD